MADRDLFVLNDKAGSFDPEFRARIEARAPGACLGGVDDIEQGTWRTIVACGGDGTVRMVVNRMVQTESSAVLAVVPLGTANVVARALGLPSDPEEALEVAMGDQERRIDVGLCDGEAFLLGCGLGAAERFVTHVGHDEKERLGAFAYVRRLLEERRSPSITFRIERPEGPLDLEGTALIVANLAQLGPSLRPLKEVEGDDGRLALILIRRNDLWTMLRIAARGLVGRSGEDEAVEIVPLRSATISTQPTVAIQIDGDPVEQDAPFRFEILPSRLLVRAPV